MLTKENSSLLRTELFNMRISNGIINSVDLRHFVSAFVQPLLVVIQHSVTMMPKATKCQQGTTAENDAATRQRYQRFLNANYSPNTFLFVIVAYFIFNECVFPDYAVLSSAVESMSINLVTYLSLALRFVVFCLVAIIWFSKTCEDTAAFPWIPQRLLNALPSMQGLYPMLMNITFSMYIIYAQFVCSELDRPQLHESGAFLAMVGLKAYPLVTFMLLRDTSPLAIAASFLLGVAVHLAVAVHSQSHREAVSFLTYTVTSGIILYDSHRQNKAAFGLVSALENTLRENEKLAVQAQALELRAMIGNVAHDLKTVR